MLTATRYFTSIFVSLGVFLFGYDQGVMSGIITYGHLLPAVAFGPQLIRLV